MYLVGTRPTIYLIKSTIKHKTTIGIVIIIIRISDLFGEGE